MESHRGIGSRRSRASSPGQRRDAGLRGGGKWRFCLHCEWAPPQSTELGFSKSAQRISRTAHWTLCQDLGYFDRDLGYFHHPVPAPRHSQVTKSAMAVTHAARKGAPPARFREFPLLRFMKCTLRTNCSIHGASRLTFTIHKPDRIGKFREMMINLAQPGDDDQSCSGRLLQKHRRRGIYQHGAKPHGRAMQ